MDCKNCVKFCIILNFVKVLKIWTVAFMNILKIGFSKLIHAETKIHLHILGGGQQRWDKEGPGNIWGRMGADHLEKKN